MYILYTHTFLPHKQLQESTIQHAFLFQTDRLCFSSHFSQISSVSDRSRLCHDHEITSLTSIVASHLTNRVAAPGTPTFQYHNTVSQYGKISKTSKVSPTTHHSWTNCLKNVCIGSPLTQTDQCSYSLQIVLVVST